MFPIVKSALLLLSYIGMPVARTVGRAGGRSVYGHEITKFSRMGNLPHFLTHGAPLRALWAREHRYRGVPPAPTRGGNALQIMGAFHYTGPTGPRPLGLTKGKWNASEPKFDLIDCWVMCDFPNSSLAVFELHVRNE